MLPVDKNFLWGFNVYDVYMLDFIHFSKSSPPKNLLTWPINLVNQLTSAI